MLGHQATIIVDDLAGLRSGPEALAQHLGEGFAGRHQAGILALGRLRGGQAVALRQRAHLGLAQVPDRKERALELRRRQARQEVGLVLGRVAAAQERGPAVGVAVAMRA